MNSYCSRCGGTGWIHQCRFPVRTDSYLCCADADLATDICPMCFGAGKPNRDPEISSYWQRILASGNLDFDGLGSWTPYKSKLHAAGHWLFQRPLRKMGRRYSHFERLLDRGHRIADSQQRQFDLSMMRQVLTIAFLRHYFPLLLDEPVLVIGDAYGMMASLVHLSAHLPVIVCNLRPCLDEDIRCFQQACGDDALRALVPVEAHNKRALRDSQFGLAINIASFQEMNLSVIHEYLDIVREKKAFLYCCNRLEKTLPDGSVIRWQDYWKPEDRFIINEPCPWHQYYYSLMPPFYHSYEGLIRHALVKFR